MWDVEIKKLFVNRTSNTKDYAPQVAPQLKPEENYQRVLKLVYDVQNANKQSAMPPVVKIVDVNHFHVDHLHLPEPTIVTDMPEHCHEFDILFCYEESIVAYPLPVYKRHHQNGLIREKEQLQEVKYTESCPT